MKHIILIALSTLSFLHAAEPQLHDVAATKEFLAQQPKALVLDVRTEEEFAQGHLAHAVRIAVSDVDFIERVKKVATPDQPILVYCRSGGRSAKAVATLKAAGFTQLHELDGGITAWLEKKETVSKEKS